MTKSKVFGCLKALAYVIGFPLMSLLMLIMFIPMLDAEFMGNLAVIWICVTLAIWAFVSIIQYVLYVATRGGGGKRNAANIAVLVIAVLSIILPGAIYGAVQADQYGKTVAAAKKDGVELSDRDSLTGWFQGFTSGKDNAVNSLQKEVDDFMYAYGINDFETSYLGTKAEADAGLGYYPGVLDKIKDELKRKTAAKKTLDDLTAQRKATADANEAILAPLRQTWKEAEALYTVASAKYDAYNDIYGRFSLIGTDNGYLIYDLPNALYNNTEYNTALSGKITAAIDKATEVLGAGAEAAEDNVIADKITAVDAVTSEIFVKTLELVTAAYENYEDAAAKQAFLDYTVLFTNPSSETGFLTLVINVINEIKDSIPAVEDITAENAQTVLNQAASAKTALDIFQGKVVAYNGDETTENSINHIGKLIIDDLNANRKIRDDNETASAEAKAVYDAKYAELTESLYKYDGYPTTVKLVFSETVYQANVTQPVEVNTYYDKPILEGGQPKTIYTKGTQTITQENAEPFKYQDYQESFEIVYEVNWSTFESTPVAVVTWVPKTTLSDATQVTKKSIPLLDTLFAALGIDYMALTEGVGDVLTELPTSGVTFTRSKNIDQIVELLLGAIEGLVPGMDLEAILGEKPTYETINSVVGYLFDVVLYPGKVVNPDMEEALNKLLEGIHLKGLLGMLLPIWDVHNGITVTEENPETDYVSGLLLTVAWAFSDKGLGDMLYGALPETLDINLGNGAIANAQAEFDKGYSVEKLKALEYELNNYPQILAFANFWHISLIFAGVVLFSLMLVMYFSQKQKQYLPKPEEEEAYEK